MKEIDKRVEKDMKLMREKSGGRKRKALRVTLKQGMH